MNKLAASKQQHKVPQNAGSNNDSSSAKSDKLSRKKQQNKPATQHKRSTARNMPHNSNSQKATRSTQNNSKRSPIINLSNRVLNDNEKKVLELGLTFCPSVQHYNKEQLAEDF